MKQDIFIERLTVKYFLLNFKGYRKGKQTQALFTNNDQVTNHEREI